MDGAVASPKIPLVTSLDVTLSWSQGAVTPTTKREVEKTKIRIMGGAVASPKIPLVTSLDVTLSWSHGAVTPTTKREVEKTKIRIMGGAVASPKIPLVTSLDVTLSWSHGAVTPTTKREVEKTKIRTMEGAVTSPKIPLVTSLDVTLSWSHGAVTPTTKREVEKTKIRIMGGAVASPKIPLVTRQKWKHRKDQWRPLHPSGDVTWLINMPPSADHKKRWRQRRKTKSRIRKWKQRVARTSRFSGGAAADRKLGAQQVAADRKLGPQPVAADRKLGPQPVAADRKLGPQPVACPSGPEGWAPLPAREGESNGRIAHCLLFIPFWRFVMTNQREPCIRQSDAGQSNDRAHNSARPLPPFHLFPITFTSTTNFFYFLIFARPALFLLRVYRISLLACSSSANQNAAFMANHYLDLYVPQYSYYITMNINILCVEWKREL